MNPIDYSHQAPLSIGFPRQGYWSGLPSCPPGDLPNLGTESKSPALQADSSSSEPPVILQKLPIGQPRKRSPPHVACPSSPGCISGWWTQKSKGFPKVTTTQKLWSCLKSDFGYKNLSAEQKIWVRFLPGEFCGERSLASSSPWGLKESDITEWLTHPHTHPHSHPHTPTHTHSHTRKLKFSVCCCISTSKLNDAILYFTWVVFWSVSLINTIYRLSTITVDYNKKVGREILTCRSTCMFGSSQQKLLAFQQFSGSAPIWQ